ncbi:Snf7 family, partial [Dillenia turbinata]
MDENGCRHDTSRVCEWMRRMSRSGSGPLVLLSRGINMSALKSANKELKGMMKTMKIQDIDNLQDEMMDLMDESHGRSYGVPDDIELDALEADMGLETKSDGVISYLQPDKEPDLDSELNLSAAPSGHAAVPAGRSVTE